jgi:hypothetical protein
MEWVGRTLAPFLRDGYLMGEDLGTTAADLVAIYRHAGIDPVVVVRTAMTIRSFN